MLDVVDIDVAFAGVPVLAAMSLTVPSGTTTALLGPSGSGKSTLLRVIAGIVVPDRGTVRIDGRDVTDVTTHRRSVGMVFQDEQLFPHLSVGDNIGYGLRVAKMPTVERRRRVDELLDVVGLAGFADRSVLQLSGGEAKRVAVARSLAPAPSVLLLDEPLTGLDAALHDRLATELAEILTSRAITAVWVTHDRAEAATVATQVIEFT